MRALLLLLLLTLRHAAAEPAALGVEPPTDDESPAARLARVHAAWAREADPARRRELADEAIDAAIALPWRDAETEDEWERTRHAVIEEVAAGGRLAGSDLAVPDAAERVALTERFSLPLSEREPETVVRRITPNHVEIWTPKHGWLFDARGRTIAEARPPRRDGVGREWFGAFLPDGRWITTDLWERDDTLYFYSAGGKLVREMPSGKLMPWRDDGTGLGRAGLIGWARADRRGKGWVVSIGSEGGRGRVWVGPTGPARELEALEPWALCQPRELGARGNFNNRYVPSDDRKLLLGRSEAGHGPRVGFPCYSVSRAGASAESAGKSIAVIPGGDRFGFWPGSHRLFITVENYDSESYGPIRPRTWFYDAKGNFECRLPARRVGDAADGRGMLFATDDGRVVNIGPDFKMTKTRRFVAGDRVLTPRELFADLGLGIFADGQRLVLATWAR